MYNNPTKPVAISSSGIVLHEKSDRISSLSNLIRTHTEAIQITRKQLGHLIEYIHILRSEGTCRKPIYFLKLQMKALLLWRIHFLKRARARVAHIRGMLVLRRMAFHQIRSHAIRYHINPEEQDILNEAADIFFHNMTLYRALSLWSRNTEKRIKIKEFIHKRENREREIIIKGFREALDSLHQKQETADSFRSISLVRNSVHLWKRQSDISRMIRQWKQRRWLRLWQEETLFFRKSFPQLVYRRQKIRFFLHQWRIALARKHAEQSADIIANRQLMRKALQSWQESQRIDSSLKMMIRLAEDYDKQRVVRSAMLLWKTRTVDSIRMASLYSLAASCHNAYLCRISIYELRVNVRRASKLRFLRRQSDTQFILGICRLVESRQPLIGRTRLAALPCMRKRRECEIGVGKLIKVAPKEVSDAWLLISSSSSSKPISTTASLFLSGLRKYEHELMLRGMMKLAVNARERKERRRKRERRERRKKREEMKSKIPYSDQIKVYSSNSIQ
ncbi:hypothetical protein ADUPG1_006938 [Aduncisulcus paluster]|uniref:Sfi1 spindle body domain-containing protein n=1 Tax=Aduncisulcus paluster TaxID=2918883 RepID=A0ABQ5KPN6_9EUKA|nr:hypothetical protein ADUPG1_006938 [Aduncisulcus paluster]